MNVIEVKNVFDRTQRKIHEIPIAPGQILTVAEAVESLGLSGIDIVVSINGGVIPKEQWNLTFLRNADELVCVPILHGNDAGKTALSALAMIATVVAAPWATGSLPFSAAFTAGRIAGATALIGGGMLVSTLIRPKPPRPEDNSLVSQGFGWEPETRQRQGSPIPMIYGKTLLVGNVIESYTEPTGYDNEQVLNMMVALGQGPIKGITNLKINDQNIDDFENLEYTFRNGLLNQDPLEAFVDTKRETAYNDKVTNASPVTHTTDNSDFDSLEIDLSFPSGLNYYPKYSPNPFPWAVKVRVEYQKNVAGSWKTLPAPDEVVVDDITLDASNDVAIHTNTPITSPSFKYSHFWHDELWYTPGEQIYVSGVGGMTQLNGNWYTIKRIVNAYKYNLTDEFGRATTGGSITGWVIILDVDGSTFDAYTSGGIVQNENIVVTAPRNPYLKMSNIIKTVAIDDIETGNKYDVKLTKVSDDKRESATGEVINTGYNDVLYYKVLREVLKREFEYPKIAYIGIKAIAMDQLSGRISFSCESEARYVRVYDGTNWGVRYTDNLAWVLWDALSQPVMSGSVAYEPTASPPADYFAVERYDGIDPSRLDLEKFYEYAQYCDAAIVAGYTPTPVAKGDWNVGTAYVVGDYVWNDDQWYYCTANNTGEEPPDESYWTQMRKRLTFNGVFDTNSDLWDATLRMCEIGRSAPVWHGTDLTVTVDEPDSPVQMFNVGNIIADSFKETFLPLAERASEIEVHYKDADRDFQRTPITVFYDQLSNYSNRVTLELFGIIHKEDAERAAKYKLYQNQLVTRMIEFDVSIDAIACTVGDVIQFQHDVPRWGEGGRILSATTNTITVDKEVDYNPVNTYQVIMRLGASPTAGTEDYIDTIITKTVSGVSGNVITFTTTFATQPTANDLFSYGEVGSVSKEFRIITITKSQDSQAKIVAAEYNADIFNCDTDETVSEAAPFSPPISWNVSNITLTDVPYSPQDGVTDRQIHVGFDPPTMVPWQGAEIYYKVDGGTRWIYSGTTKNSNYVIHYVQNETTYYVKVLSLSSMGKKNSIQNAPDAQITTGTLSDFDRQQTPQKVGGLELQGQANDSEFTGKHAKLTWRRAAVIKHADLFDGPAGTYQPDLWLKDYEVVIKTDDSDEGIRRTVYTQETQFIYTYEMNVEDGLGVPVRSLIVEVKARDIYNRLSLVPARIHISNPAPTVLENISLESFPNQIKCTWDISTDLDLQGYKIWGSTTPGFSPASGNLLYKGTNNEFNYFTDDDSVWYFKFAGYDTFDETIINTSAQYSESIQVADWINWLGAWSDAVTYQVNDGVSYNGASYLCILSHLNQPPPSVTYWDVLADKGDAGATGPKGDPGDDGTFDDSSLDVPLLEGATWSCDANGVDLTGTITLHYRGQNVTVNTLTDVTHKYIYANLAGTIADPLTLSTHDTFPDVSLPHMWLFAWHDTANNKVYPAPPGMKLLNVGFLKVNTLAAITADMGTLTSGTIVIDATGAIYSSGKTSYSSTTAGFWEGYDGTAYKVNIGNATNYFKFNGTSAEFRGGLNADNITTGTLTVGVASVSGDYECNINDGVLELVDYGALELITGTTTRGILTPQGLVGFPYSIQITTPSATWTQFYVRSENSTTPYCEIILDSTGTSIGGNTWGNNAVNGSGTARIKGFWLEDCVVSTQKGFDLYGVNTGRLLIGVGTTSKVVESDAPGANEVFLTDGGSNPSYDSLTSSHLPSKTCQMEHATYTGDGVNYTSSPETVVTFSFEPDYVVIQGDHTSTETRVGVNLFKAKSPAVDTARLFSGVDVRTYIELSGTSLILNGLALDNVNAVNVEYHVIGYKSL